MMRSGVAVVLLPPCRLGLGRIRQAQFKDTQFQAFEALTLSVAFSDEQSLTFDSYTIPEDDDEYQQLGKSHIN
ncbi:putative cytochrome-c oxidase [Helianthus annuus]|nr:putative cytochrome-c oxidase [Helianthus annuus]